MFINILYNIILLVLTNLINLLLLMRETGSPSSDIKLLYFILQNVYSYLYPTTTPPPPTPPPPPISTKTCSR